MSDCHPAFDITNYLDQQKARVDDALGLLLPSEDTNPEILHRAMRYSLFAGGKRLRPILALATGEALEGDRRRMIYLACALECIHTYSLIHDDLPAMDNDDYRRGQLTCHKKFGEGIAILAGNGLLTHAFQMLTEIPGNQELSGLTLSVTNYLCRAIGSQVGIIAGQVADLVTEGKAFSEDELHFIHSAKTGALIEASVSCAAMLSGAEETVLERCSRFGRKIGLAFQIVDDILDVEETSAQLGKTSGKDRADQKATFPALVGLDASRRRATELVNEALEDVAFLGPRAAALRELAHFISVRRF